MDREQTTVLIREMIEEERREMRAALREELRAEIREELRAELRNEFQEIVREMLGDLTISCSNESDGAGTSYSITLSLGESQLSSDYFFFAHR